MSISRLAGLSCAVAVLTAALLPAPVRASPGDEGPGVYLRLVEAAPTTLDEAATRLEAALADLGWQVFEPLDCGVNADKCSFRTRVITATHPAYIDRIMTHGRLAAFAAPIRFGVYEDEAGVHVAATNPANLNRTIVNEDTTPGDGTWAVGMIRDVGRVAFPDHLVEAEYGQRREDARIGRTMGVMAGGPFGEKVDLLSTLPAGVTSPTQIADLLVSYMESVDGEWEWGIHPVYVLHLPEHGASVVGVSGRRMEAKAFDIVGSGNDDTRDDLACPGIDHAPAFPIEILAAEDEGEITVSLVDEMYRMKMFFEDAGKWAFMKNMGMPGSIEDEIRSKVQAILN